MPWSSAQLVNDGQTDWLVRLYEKTINGMRSLGGLPSEVNGTLNVSIPPLGEQARVMRYRVQLPPGKNPPTGVVNFI